MGMAEIALVLWRGHLKHNPANPAWPDRDRFVLSNGHGSMLLYALLHLTGYDLPLDELKRFRQLHSKTPGHPELGVTPGVETTTGPLGQGLTNAVGMALAEQLLAREFNRPGHAIVDHHTYVFVGDGCLMEGISHEAGSLAGTLGLGKLIAFYDDNGISIDGHVEHWFADDTPQRFEAYGWHVVRDIDGHDPAAIEAALAQAERGLRPTDAALLQDRDRQGQSEQGRQPRRARRAARRRRSRRDTRRAGLGARAFEIPARGARGVGRARARRRRAGALATPLRCLRAGVSGARRRIQAPRARRAAGGLGGAQRAAARRRRPAGAPTIATRKASQNALELLQPKLPELLGGSADLTGSNLTATASSVPVRRRRWGNHINYGVREFGMSALMNGIALHGGYIPYGGTFLTFSDYSRNAIRMAALMRQRVIFVLTHDSIGLGEDGPTHQPVEHVSSLRLIPNNSRVATVRRDRNHGRVDRGDRTPRGPDLPDPVAPEPAAQPARRAAAERHPPRWLRVGAQR